MLQVMKQACSTCIYRDDSPLDLAELEDKVRDSRGEFVGYRICHHHDKAVCRGFWNRHKDEFQLGQLVQRMGMIEEVDPKWE